MAELRGGQQVKPLDSYTSTGAKFWHHMSQMEAYRAGDSDTVISTHVSPTGVCNLRCKYCSTDFRDPSRNIPLAVIQDYVERLQRRGLRAVILTGGGEPMLYPEITELIHWLAYDRKLRVALITNGTQMRKVDPRLFYLLDWVRISVNLFDGWEEKIEGTDVCSTVGLSIVYTDQHQEAPSEPWVEIFRKVSKLADRTHAKYVRVLPNCLLKQEDLLARHVELDALFAEVGDGRFFHQFKVHRTPQHEVCHQSYFRPYLSEVPWHETGEPGSVYPCDSVVLNPGNPGGDAEYGHQHFAPEYQLCRPQDVLKYIDGKIPARFMPKVHCAGCVFADTVDMLGRWKADGARPEKTEEDLRHVAFV